MKLPIIKFLLVFYLISSIAQAQSKTVRVDNFKSAHVKERNIDIWLPAAYFENTNQKFPVLYMHDGQNLFDSSKAGYGTAWEADDIAAKLIKEGKVQPFIIVGVWNTDLRYFEYFPEKAAQYLSAADREQMEKVRQQMGIKQADFLGDEYLKFLTAELKPYIDKNYRTIAGPESTSVAGSSMGGLISMYAICEYPNIFGQAACVSTHWPLLFDNSNMNPSDAVRKYMEEHLPDPKGHRIYFDYGTATLDQYYEVHQKMVDELMRTKGYTEGGNWVTRKFEGAEHNEKSWQARLDVIFEFLYAGKRK